ncbi:MAG: chemotaxis protein CheA [Phycisphaerae bacterium]|nr:chemotaxis protein CheA [Phycisphaerae bacterium]
MPEHEIDPGLTAEFVAESAERLDQAERDLAALDRTPEDRALIDGIFRSLHTIKGNASCLRFTEPAALAHAAETALHAARTGRVRLGPSLLDLLRAGVDALRTQLADIDRGGPITPADDALLRALGAIPAPEAPDRSPAPPSTDAAAHAEHALDAIAAGLDTLARDVRVAPAPDRESPLELPSNKESLVEILAADLRETLAGVDIELSRLARAADHADAAARLADLCEGVARSLDFFGLGRCAAGARALMSVGRAAPLAPETRTATDEIMRLLRDQCGALTRRVVLDRPIDAALRALADAAPPRTAPGSVSTPLPHAPTIDAAPRDEAPCATDTRARASPAATPRAPSVRVDVARLDALLDLAGETVRESRRVTALARAARHERPESDVTEAVARAAENLHHTGSLLRSAAMRVRLQPFDRIFSRFPQLVRDLARTLGKSLALHVEGAATEADRSVVEALADPLVHLIRNAADHAIEPPDARRAVGKPPTGSLTLSAETDGGAVRVRVADDGRGLCRRRIVEKAVEMGMLSRDRADAMSDREIHRLVFAPGFSTAAQVSGVSGRGVGMDVVRATIERLGGSVELDSTEGRGTTVTITLPLTLVVINALLVRVRGTTGTPDLPPSSLPEEVYALPVASVVEVMNLADTQRRTIRARPVVIRPDGVLPLIDLREALGAAVSPATDTDADTEHPSFVVVLRSNGTRIGLLVSRLIGRSEIVVKPLDALAEGKGPVCGATVRDDGGVSLILDPDRLVAPARMGESPA